MSRHICLFVYLFSERKLPGVNVNSVNFRGTLVLLGFKVTLIYKGRVAFNSSSFFPLVSFVACDLPTVNSLIKRHKVSKFRPFFKANSLSLVQKLWICTTIQKPQTITSNI